jgi:hypothetical protein
VTSPSVPHQVRGPKCGIKSSALHKPVNLNRPIVQNLCRRRTFPLPTVVVTYTLLITQIPIPQRTRNIPAGSAKRAAHPTNAAQIPPLSAECQRRQMKENTPARYATLILIAQSSILNQPACLQYFYSSSSCYDPLALPSFLSHNPHRKTPTPSKEATDRLRHREIWKEQRISGEDQTIPTLHQCKKTGRATNNITQ